MNQILSVDPNSNRRKSKSSIHSILIVFSVILMIFGIGVAITGGYSYYKNNSRDKDNSDLVLSTKTKPEISIEREDASKINIVVTHDKEFASVKYSINNEEFIEIESKGKKQIEKEVVLKPGKSDITIIAEDINGISSSRESSIEVEQKPTIELEKVENQIQITTESQINIDYILYYWDEDTENAKKLTINGERNVTLVDVLEGVHTLNIKAVDTQGNETTKSKKIKGDMKPEIKIKTNGEVFLITAADDEGLTKIEITLNSNETITEEINDKTYSTKINLESGVNKLTVKVYNKNDITETSRVKYTKE